MFASDRERERASVALRTAYVDGRLTLDEVSDRAGRIVAARSREDLRRALDGLPWWHDELRAQGRAVARGVARGALLLACTAAWLLFSFALFVVLGLTVLFQGASGSTLLAFVAVWLVPTYGLSRLWRARR